MKHCNFATNISRFRQTEIGLHTVGLRGKGRAAANNVYKSCRQNYFVIYNSGVPARLIY
jgi:hypothetical protein